MCDDRLLKGKMSSITGLFLGDVAWGDCFPPLSSTEETARGAEGTQKTGEQTTPGTQILSVISPPDSPDLLMA